MKKFPYLKTGPFGNPIFPLDAYMLSWPNWSKNLERTWISLELHYQSLLFLSKFWANVNWNGDTFYDANFNFPHYYRAKEIASLPPKIFFLVHITLNNFLELSFNNDWQMRIYLLWRSVLCEKWSALKNNAVFRKLIRYKLFLNKNMYIPKHFFSKRSYNYYISVFFLEDPFSTSPVIVWFSFLNMIWSCGL